MTAGGTAASAAELALLRRALGAIRPRPFAVRMWDGLLWEADPEPARFTLELRRPGAARALLLDPTLAGIGELYMAGAVDLSGDLPEAFAAAERLEGMRPGLPARLLRGLARIRLSSNGHSPRGAAAVNAHYDLPLPFFRLWLDPELVYSCAYFERPDEDLETAQRRKLDYVCRKLRLRHGERLLDVGCGWGALLRHAAARHGVTATGITLSEGMAAVARERAAAAGLQERVTVEVRDLFDLADREAFDKIACIGVVEHVPERLQAPFFARLHRLLRPGGLALNQGIASSATHPLAGGHRFLRRHVFPGHELVPIGSLARAAESAGFEVRDVESLREHYARTLRLWYERLTAAGAEACQAAGDRTVRAFSVYLAGMSHHFANGDLNLYQVLLARPDAGRSGLPLTRRDLYS